MQALKGPWSDEALRIKALNDIADVLEKETESLARLIVQEQGKPLPDAMFEVAIAVNMARSFAAWEDEETVFRDNEMERIISARSPLGVVGLIVPWNFPITILFMKLAPALRVGNSIIIKPAPTTPLSTIKMLELIQPLIPEDVVHVVPGGPEMGAALTAHPDVAKVSFTGSTAAGRKVMRTAAPTLKRITLELGGNDPAVLFADADLERALPMIAFSAIGGPAGQICQAIKRVYVERPLYQAVVDGLEAMAQGVVVGDGLVEGTMTGPVHTATQKAFVEDLLAQARAAGARVFNDGPVLPDLPGHLLRPAIVSGVSADAAIVMQEQFGPVMPIVPFDTEEEAIRLANNSEYGLDASVWSQDEDRALAVAKQICAGSLFINKHANPPDPAIPFGGAKQSGFGSELGNWGVDDLSQRHIIGIGKAA